jgi:hypothetical protein
VQQISWMAVNLPRPPRLPLLWGGRRACRAGWVPAVTRPPTSLVSPTATWASVVRGDVCAGAGEPACPTTQPAPAGPAPQPAVSSADFSALYEHCLASGLKVRLMFSHAAGIQSITLSCSLPTATKIAIAEKRRRRRRRHQGRRGAAITVGANTNLLPYTDVAATAVAAPAGCNVSAPSSPEISTPPPKRKRRRCNEVELLQEPEMDGELLLSPLSCAASTPSSSPPRCRALSTASIVSIASSPLLPPAPPAPEPVSPPPTPPGFAESPLPAAHASADSPSSPADRIHQFSINQSKTKTNTFLFFE